jgi:hypothetical protein
MNCVNKDCQKSRKKAEAAAQCGIGFYCDDWNGWVGAEPKPQADD